MCTKTDLEQNLPLKDTKEEPSKEVTPEPLNGKHIWNITFCFLAWACTVCNVTLVVGTSALVLLSIGDNSDLTTFPLGAFFLGASSVSLLLTPWIFFRFGRKISFLIGVGLSTVGSGLGALSVTQKSIALNIIANFFFGTAVGIGFFLRYVAVDVVPKHFAAKAVTLVVAGGCIAAFAGPESAGATKDMFDTVYLGVFLMTALYNTANAFFTTMIDFPAVESPKNIEWPVFRSLLRQSGFILPLFTSTVAWAAMSMPMGLVRVAMGQLGFSQRQSLTVIEFHFLGMYGTGFLTGNLIQRFGPVQICLLSTVVFGASMLFTLNAGENDSDGAIALWLIGLTVVGAAWNLGFTSSTVWLLQLCKGDKAEYKTYIQAANDVFMFFFAGCWACSASYLFEAGGSGLDGWKTLNYVVIAIFGSLFLVLSAFIVQTRATNNP